MKLAKTALVIALASVGTMAAAESQVTLYGTIDGAVVVNKAKGGDATVSLEDGIAGGSVWGIEGSEDLGNGYSVGFLLETVLLWIAALPGKKARPSANRQPFLCPEISVNLHSAAWAA